jgi:hypothetical protein
VNGIFDFRFSIFDFWGGRPIKIENRKLKIENETQKEELYEQNVNDCPAGVYLAVLFAGGVSGAVFVFAVHGDFVRDIYFFCFYE